MPGKLSGRDILMLFLLLPYFVLCFFVVPAADDFTFSVITLENGFWGAQHKWYGDWTGRFASSFFLSLFPQIVESLFWYRLVCFLSLLAFAGVFVFFIKTLYQAIFKRESGYLLPLLLLNLALANVPAINQTFYWRPATVTYMWALVLLLVGLGVLLKIRADSKTSGYLRVCTGLLIVITALLSGLNEIVILLWLFILCCYVLFLNPPRRNLIFFLILIGGAGFLVMALAPGNSVRSGATEFVGNKNVLRTIYRSFTLSIEVFFRYLKPDLIFLMPLSIPWLLEMRPAVDPQIYCSKNIKRLSLVFAGTLMLYLMPAQWAMNGAPPSRAMNVACVWHLLFLLCVFAVWVWNSPERAQRIFNFTIGKVGSRVGWILVFCSLVLFGNHGTAISDLLFKVGSYNREAQSRYDKYKQGGDVTVPAFRAPPMTIFFDDITADPNDWRNSSVGKYFGLKSLRISP